MNTRVAIVTGAGSGIGRAAALRLGSLGYSTVLVGRRAEPLQAVADELAAAKDPSLVLPADLSQPEAAQPLVERTVATFGRIDLLLNAAGMVVQQPLAEMTPDAWRELLDANLSSAFLCTRAVWPVMKQQAGGGVIINISSMAARDPFPGLGAYAVAKSGLNMLTLVSAREGASAGIRVFGIAPGAVDTGMFRGLVGEENVNTEEILQPDDIADVIAAMAAGTLRFAAGETLYLNRRPA